MDTRCPRLIGVVVVLVLGARESVLAQASAAGERGTPGRFDFGVSHRTFDAPLFGTDSTTAYHLFGSQVFPGAGTYAFWLSGGFPSTTTFYGVEGSGVPILGRLGTVSAGDFVLAPVGPDGSAAWVADTLPLVGMGFRLSDGRSTWRAYGGTAKYGLESANGPTVRPSLYGGDVMTRWGGNYVGLGLTMIEDPVYRDPQSAATRAFVGSARFVREITPWTGLFAEAYSSGDSLGYRAGISWRTETVAGAFSFYSFGDDFPGVVPLYRPGEKGLELRGRYQPSESASVHGRIDYGSDPTVLERSNLRGNVGLQLDFGSDRPHLAVDVSHDEIAYGSLLDPDRGVVMNRYAVTLAKSTTHDSLTSILEHDSGTDTALDRTQALVLLSRVVGSVSLLDGSFVAQRDEAGSLGFTGEAAVERPLRGRFNYVLGAGAAVVQRDDLDTGEGVLRLGISRPLFREGWSMRLEVRLPFSIGLERSDLNRRIASLDIGSRLGWKNLPSHRAEALEGSQPRETGVIEGVVKRDGEGVGGLPVWVSDGSRTVTRSDGSFRVRRTAVGESFVTLDLRSLDPSYSVAGGPTREVEVRPREVSHLEFRIARFSSLQGAVLVCTGGKTRPASGARVTLVDATSSRSAVTSVLGGFQIDEIPPGSYEVRVEAAETSVRLQADLRQDCVAQVVRLGCGSAPAETDEDRVSCLRESFDDGIPEQATSPQPAPEAP
jgi:hypothetical protein